jgi:hypothetical protein
MVMDDNPSDAQVTFGGVLSGTVTPNALGQFSFQADASSLGAVTAVAHDAQGMTSNTAQALLPNLPPSLTFSVTYGAENWVTLTGMVADESPAGRTVTFSGAVSGSVVTTAGGMFSLTLRGSLGAVHANTTDQWGQAATTASVNLVSSAPVITEFEAVHASYGNVWTFRGRVSDEYRGGLTVQLGGVGSLATQTVTVDANGYFSITVELQPGESGLATARVTDWWGLQSAVVTDSVCL